MPTSGVQPSVTVPEFGAPGGGTEVLLSSASFMSAVTVNAPPGGPNAAVPTCGVRPLTWNETTPLHV